MLENMAMFALKSEPGVLVYQIYREVNSKAGSDDIFLVEK